MDTDPKKKKKIINISKSKLATGMRQYVRNTKNECLLINKHIIHLDGLKVLSYVIS